MCPVNDVFLWKEKDLNQISVLWILLLKAGAFDRRPLYTEPEFIQSKEKYF